MSLVGGLRDWFMWVGVIWFSQAWVSFGFCGVSGLYLLVELSFGGLVVCGYLGVVF